MDMLNSGPRITGRNRHNFLKQFSSPVTRTPNMHRQMFIIGRTGDREGMPLEIRNAFHVQINVLTGSVDELIA